MIVNQKYYNLSITIKLTTIAKSHHEDINLSYQTITKFENDYDSQENIRLERGLSTLNNYL